MWQHIVIYVEKFVQKKTLIIVKKLFFKKTNAITKMTKNFLKLDKATDYTTFIFFSSMGGFPLMFGSLYVFSAVSTLLQTNMYLREVNTRRGTLCTCIFGSGKSSTPRKVLPREKVYPGKSPQF